MNSAEIILHELEEIHEEPDAFLYTDYILRMKELLETLRDDPEQISTEIVRLEETLKSDSCCPKCGSNLKIRENQDSRECYGIDCFETISTEYCSECGWTEDKD